jgi:hypothetical protein
VQELALFATAKARLYASGPPVESVAAAVVALTYGAKAMPDAAADDDGAAGAGAGAEGGRDWDTDWGGPSPTVEHAVLVSAIIATRTSPAAEPVKLRIVHAPALLWVLPLYQNQCGATLRFTELPLRRRPVEIHRFLMNLMNAASPIRTKEDDRGADYGQYRMT